MKKIFTYSLVAFVAVILLASCSRRDWHDDRDSWYTQERGIVIKSSDYCDFFIVELNDTYAIMQSMDSKANWPYPDDYIYGNFNSASNSTRNFLNDAGTVSRQDDYVTPARIVEFVNSRTEAINAMVEEYCGGVAKSDVQRVRPIK